MKSRGNYPRFFVSESLNGEIILTPPPPPSPSFSFSTHIDTVEKWVYPFIFVVFRCLPFLELAPFLLAVVVRRDCRAAASERLLRSQFEEELDFICEILKVELSHDCYLLPMTVRQACSQLPSRAFGSEAMSS